MQAAARASTWADYVLMLDVKISRKPRNIPWVEPAATPLNALAAWQVLFEVVGLTEAEPHGHDG